MVFYMVKLLVSAGLIVLVSELAKTRSVWAGFLASLPLVSLLSLVWLHVETGDAVKTVGLARSVLWLVLPSLIFFVVFPFLMKRGVSFWGSFCAGVAVMGVGYGVALWGLRVIGVYFKLRS